jgi:hypothetical protein
MWRVRWPDGSLSDMANLSRAKDAAFVIAQNGPPARDGKRLHWQTAPIGEAHRRPLVRPAPATPMTRPKRLTSLAQIDQRTIAARQVHETIAAIEVDQGGRDQMTTAMQKVAETAAVTTAMVNDMAAKWLNGEEVDPALFCTLANAQRRLFETLGFERIAKDLTPSVNAYLAQKNSTET